MPGRYAYGNQPRIAQWNLARFAETLLPLLGENEDKAVAVAKEALSEFAPRFQAAYLGGLQRKLGLANAREGDVELAQDLLTLMAENGADFTLTFRRLCDAAVGPGGDGPMRELYSQMPALSTPGRRAGVGASQWKQRIQTRCVLPCAR